MAVLTGSASAVRPVASLQELEAEVDLGRLSRTPARFDEAELRTLVCEDAARPPVRQPSKRVSTRLGIAGPKAEPFWMAVRGNLSRFGDVAEWWGVVEEPRRANDRGPHFLEQALASLPPAPWDAGNLVGLDRRLEDFERAKGQGAVSPVAAGAYGA